MKKVTVLTTLIFAIAVALSGCQKHDTSSTASALSSDDGFLTAADKAALAGGSATQSNPAPIPSVASTPTPIQTPPVQVVQAQPASNTIPPFAQAQALSSTTTAKPALSGKSFAKVNNVGINLSQELLDKGDLRGAISSYYEGYRARCYPDNVGVACGYGYNTYFHTKEQVASLIKPIVTDSTQFSALVAQAKVKDMLSSTRDVNLSPEQAASMLAGTYDFYDAPIRALLGKDYDKLSDNEKAAMFYNDYKAGSPYSNLKTALKKYVANPTAENKANVIQNIHYSYMLNGKRIEDTRGTAGVQAMFESKDAFAAIIGKNPSYITKHDLTAEIPAYKGMHFNNVQSIDEQTPDPVGVIKEQYYEEGKPIPFTQEDLIEAAKLVAKPVRRGGNAAPGTWF